MTENERKTLAFLGFAARARALTIGVPLICEALKKGAKGKTPQAVIEASDTSENTHKRVCDRIKYYDVFHQRIDVTGEELARAIGKRDSTVGAVGVTDPHLAAAVIALWQAKDDETNN